MSYTQLKAAFREAFDVARSRIDFASKEDLDDRLLEEYARKRYSLFNEKPHMLKSLAQTVGYFCGNYSKFISSQERLDVFDERVDMLEEKLGLQP